jgi:hypothetical protein
MRRARDGTLSHLSETRVEQSFNERLFAELFDYRTLYRHGAGEYHLEPKQQYQGGRYDDFALGFFRPGSRHQRVSAELKSPGADLDAPQAAYGGVTPIQQAFRAVTSTPSVRWILVSNFDEIRLYHARDPSRCERVTLSDVLSIGEMRRLLALLSRHTLVGMAPDEESPLDRCLSRSTPMIIPQRAGLARLVHQVVPNTLTGNELALHQMDDALRAGLAAMPQDFYMWPLRLPTSAPSLKDDRLVLADIVEGKALSVTELTRSGALRVSEYLNDETAADQGRAVFKADDLAVRIALFFVFAREVYSRLFRRDVGGLYTWELLEVAGAVCGYPSGWVSNWVGTPPRLAPDIHRTVVPPQSWSADFAAMPLAQHTAFAVRELLFPFEMRTPATGAVQRIAPHDNAIQHLLKQNPFLAGHME